MTTADDELVLALDGVVGALADACEESSVVSEHATAIRNHRRQGNSVSQLAGTDEGGIVVHVSGLLSRLNSATTRLRRAQAREMRSEGATTERIASVLGVTRQRVSALLRNEAKRAG